MSRRAMMARVAAGVVSYSSFVASGASVAADSIQQVGTSSTTTTTLAAGESNQAAAERKRKEEEEARRIAEETKQRLAAGRIGRI